jgi:hypothetical protein
MDSIKIALEKSQYKDNLINVDGVYLLLNPKWNKISVSVSGGADSALLLFLLAKLIDEKNLNIEIHVITNIRMWKTRPWQRKNSIDVFQWVSSKFPNISFKRHENFIAPELEYGAIGPIIPNAQGIMKSGDQISVKSHAEYVCFTYDIDAWFAGITKNPDSDSITLKMSDRDQEFDGNVDSLIYDNNNTLLCHPFKYHTKQWIVTQYKKLNIEELLLLTRSCEGDTKAYPEIFRGLDYMTYTETSLVPECGKCFWCQERTWAIEQSK